jgi:hypothetical protein
VWPEIEAQKIDHVAVEKAVSEIAEDTGEKKAESNSAPRIARFLAHEQDDDDAERDAGKRDEEAVVVPE